MKLTWSPVSGSLRAGSSSDIVCAHASRYLTKALLLRGSGQPFCVQVNPRRPRPPSSSTSQVVPAPSLLPPRVCSPSGPLLSVSRADHMLSFSDPKPPCSISRVLPETLRTPTTWPCHPLDVTSHLLSLWSQHSSPTDPLTGPSSAPPIMGGRPPRPQRGCRAREYTQTNQDVMDT